LLRKRHETVWTPEKIERLKKLVLKHVANGGSVQDACQQFAYETNGAHKAKAVHLKWLMSVRHQCRDEWKRAVELGLKAKVLKIDNFENQSEEINMQTIHEDELVKKLYQAVEQLVEDRRQTVVSMQEYQKQAEYYEKRILDLEEEKRMAELRFEKKEREIERLNRELIEKQSKYDQLMEDYQQMRANDAKEYERLQYQLKELQSKYETLMSDYNRYRSQSAIELERLENSLRDEQIKNAQLQIQYEQIRKENSNLTKRITDFAQQISAALSVDQPTQTPVTPVPIRPVVSKDSNDAAI
jgi:chromosome segregation ATPase